MSVVHVVDDDEAIRNSLKLFLESANLNVRLYDSAHNFLNNYHNSEPACILIDVRMPNISGLQLQQLLKEKNIITPVIVMTGYGDVPTAVKAMKAGAIDFVEKPFDHDYLLSRIHNCLDQCKYKHKQHESLNRLSLLTAREREVFELIAEGNINKVIAEKLHISPRTVEAHRANVMDKLQAQSLSDIVRLSLLTTDTNS